MYQSYLLTISFAVNYNAMTRPVLAFPLGLTLVIRASTVSPATPLDRSRIAVINDHGPHLQGSSTALASAERRDVSFDILDILDVRSVDSNRYEEPGDEHQPGQEGDGVAFQSIGATYHPELSGSSSAAAATLEKGNTAHRRNRRHDIKTQQERLTQLKETLEKRPGGKEKFAEGNSQVIEGLLDDIRAIEQVVVSQKDAKQEHEVRAVWGKLSGLSYYCEGVRKSSKSAAGRRY
ncbi:hypothetical protein F5880DRAFT_1509855 [Lentinula raphanica]|nr:hypothetical protein F5880DRAFT_1509855 [Lentinula raphanica]